MYHKGPGSFFKAHKDTPRSENMFGSLVVVFPTRHEGGALQLRHKEEEWTFDSAAITSAQESPSIAYIAFHSDVEHEVSMVRSGFRVTLTYNLYIDDDSSNPSLLCLRANEMALRTSLSSLLRDRNLLPEGGYLGFGLEFQYPLAHGGTKLDDLINSLKGGDAMIKRVLDHLDLDPQLKVIYDGTMYGLEENPGENQDSQDNKNRPSHRYSSEVVQIMLDDIDRFPDYELQSSLVEALSLRTVGGVVVCDADKAGVFWDERGRRIQVGKVLWITRRTRFSRVKSAFIEVNHASLGFTYGSLCLLVPVSASGKRVKNRKEI